METSVLIIGGGITGTAISRELSKYEVKVTIIEKEADIAFGGATKANTAIIHAGMRSVQRADTKFSLSYFFKILCFNFKPRDRKLSHKNFQDSS